jgi:hypothetical protein
LSRWYLLLRDLCDRFWTLFSLCSPVTLVVSAIPSSTFCAYVSLIDRLDGIV